MTSSRATSSFVTWSENDTPISKQYDDVYYSKLSGLDESRYVFLENNFLPERWLAKKRFSIGELGFGTGLNFLATWELWSRNPGAFLSYFSIEKFPLHAEEITRALTPWPELSSLCDQLIKYYPPPVPGLHRIAFPECNVELTLAFGDASHYLPTIEGAFDAWYLDGFSPTKNPELWSSGVLSQVARMAAEGSTFSTFTSARSVRDTLSNVGYHVEKASGFGKKREMCRGALIGNERSQSKKPRSPKKALSTSALVIGGGITGTSVAYSLAKRGLSVTLLERESSLARMASGNEAAIVMPYPTVENSPRGRFFSSAFLYTTSLVAQLREQGHDIPGDLCGVLRLTSNERTANLYRKLPKQGLPQSFVECLAAREIKERFDLDSQNDGLFFPQAGWIHPASLCKALCAAYPERIQVLLNKDINRLTFENGAWEGIDNVGESVARAEIVICCNAFDAARFEQCHSLPLQRIRGQVALIGKVESLDSLSLVVCHEGYAIPRVTGRTLIGATYDKKNLSSLTDRSSRIELIEKLRTHLDVTVAESDIEEERVGFRTATPDKMPIIGERENSFFLSIAHGSRGCTSGPFSGEILASQILGETLPIDAPTLDLISPTRYCET